MAKPVRIGFVGVGNMGQCAHLKHYPNISGCEVAAIAEPRKELSRLVAARYGVPHTYRDAEEMIANEALDGLVVIQPFDRHGSVLLPLFRYGLPILSEKPLASSVPMGEAMLRALNEGGSWHMVGYHKRSDPATCAAKAEIDRLKSTGELGALTYVRITMPAGDWIAGGFADLIRTDEQPPELDRAAFEEFGRFANYYIHQVNLMRHLLGEPFEPTYLDSNRLLLAVQGQSGATGIIEMSPYRTTVDWHESAIVAFERGFVRLALPAPLASNRPGEVEFFRDPGGRIPETIRPRLPWVSAMSRQAVNFVEAICGGVRPPCEASEALDDLRIVERYVGLTRT